MTKREKLFERVNSTLTGNKDVFVFTASINEGDDLVFNAFFEHGDFDHENPPRSLQAGSALVNSIKAAVGEDLAPEEGNDNVH